MTLFSHDHEDPDPVDIIGTPEYNARAEAFRQHQLEEYAALYGTQFTLLSA